MSDYNDGGRRTSLMEKRDDTQAYSQEMGKQAVEAVAGGKSDAADMALLQKAIFENPELAAAFKRLGTKVTYLADTDAPEALKVGGEMDAKNAKAAEIGSLKELEALYKALYQK